MKKLVTCLRIILLCFFQNMIQVCTKNLLKGRKTKFHYLKLTVDKQRVALSILL